MRGHLRALLIMRALSMLRLSLGSPSSSQARILTGSPMTFASLNCALHGMPADLQTPTHVQTVWSKLLYKLQAGYYVDLQHAGCPNAPPSIQ